MLALTQTQTMSDAAFKPYTTKMCIAPNRHYDPITNSGSFHRRVAHKLADAIEKAADGDVKVRPVCGTDSSSEYVTSCPGEPTTSYLCATPSEWLGHGPHGAQLGSELSNRLFFLETDGPRLDDAGGVVGLNPIGCPTAKLPPVMVHVDGDHFVCMPGSGPHADGNE